MTQFLLMLVPAFVMIGVYAALVKLSSVVSRLKLSWAHSLLFAILLAAVVIMARVIAVVTQVSPPLSVALISGVLLNLFLGGWFLSKRAIRRDGQPAGVPGGVRIGAVMVVLCGFAGLVLMGILAYARSVLN